MPSAQVIHTPFYGRDPYDEPIIVSLKSKGLPYFLNVSNDSYLRTQSGHGRWLLGWTGTGN